jgi:hypothetical protein
LNSVSWYYKIKQLNELYTTHEQFIVKTVIDFLCSYSTIAWVASLKKGVQHDVAYGYKTTT